MNSVILFFFGQHLDALPMYEKLEEQKRADERLRIFSQLPIKRKNIICQPMISAISPIQKDSC